MTPSQTSTNFVQVVTLFTKPYVTNQTFLIELELIARISLILTDSTFFLELGRLEVAAAKAERRGDREGFRDQESLRPGEREWGQEEIVSMMSDQTELKNVILLLLDMSYAMADSTFEMMT